MKQPFFPAPVRITEVFSSIQGEGPLMGERHIFIRFKACHLSCVYCDEAGKKSRSMTLAEILLKVKKLEEERGPHTYVSLTGGEPLLREDFLRILCPALKKMKFKILLETNGILWRSFSKVLRCCDIIAMDLKLSSVTRQKSFFEEHRKFLRIAKRKKVYLKIVISKNIDSWDYEKHIRMVSEVAPGAPVFLQPVSSSKKVYPDTGLLKLLDRLQRTGAKRLSDVRIGIQLHKLLNIC